jgi:hypothetical protein
MNKCPGCGRTDLKVRANKFGDSIWPRHKMATISGGKQPLPEKVITEFFWKPGVNPDAYPLWEMDCPESGQPL